MDCHSQPTFICDATIALMDVVNYLQLPAMLNEKTDFSESSMTLMVLHGNEMKRPCALESDCSLSGPDRRTEWTV